MKTMGAVEFECPFLKDANLEMCRGCFLCVRRGKEKCPIKDEQRKIEERILEMDGVIFYSPVYGMNVSALMKKFIDRFSYNGHHPQFFKQRALFVSTTFFYETEMPPSLKMYGFAVRTLAGILKPILARNYSPKGQ